jgi:D-threonate/D-erythronate kinase
VACRDPLDCLLIADDLTGACDAAAPFALAGRRTVVVLSPAADPGDAQVLAVSTESRDLPPCEIPAAIAAAAARLPPGSARVIFKKIDSTLRGHTAVEIAAVFEAFDCQAAVVCPAFPAMHRLVTRGHLHITTAPDFSPIHLATHLSSAHLSPAEFDVAISRGARILSCDAECDADLDRIAAEIAALDGQILWAGSAGLASALARLLPPAGPRVPKPPRPGPVLFCIGSDHPVTVAQQRALLDSRNTLALDCDAGAEQITEASAHGLHILFHIPRDRITAETLCQKLPRGAAALMLSGGDTASLLCRPLGVAAIDLCDEIVPGIPRGILRGGRFDGMPVVTKSGGFGASDALIQIADYFSCNNR